MKMRHAFTALLTIGILAFIIHGRTEMNDSAPGESGVPEAVTPIPSETPNKKNVIKNILKPNMNSNASLPLDIELEKKIFKARKFLAKTSMMTGKTAEELHTTPPEVLRSAEAIGEIAVELKKHPELISQAIPFYLECALDPDGMSSTRALCAYRLDRYRANWDEKTKAGVALIPAEIQTLKEKIGN